LLIFHSFRVWFVIAVRWTALSHKETLAGILARASYCIAQMISARPFAESVDVMRAVASLALSTMKQATIHTDSAE